MEIIITCFEILGAIAFAVSGAMIALEKNMDIFGVCMLGIVTAVGGGFMRDITIGNLPPEVFTKPTFMLLALAVSIIIFFPFIRKKLFANRKLYDTMLLVADSIGLSVFTVYGAGVALDGGYSSNYILMLFVAVVTGVGGGVIRDILAGNRPYIFVKHIYALASIFGATVYYFINKYITSGVAFIVGFSVIFIIRILSAHFHWSLPKAQGTTTE